MPVIVGGIVIGLIFIFLGVLVGMGLSDKWKGTHYLCDILGWHNGDAGKQIFNGINYVAACSKCNRKVLMDSQGNWFQAHEQ